MSFFTALASISHVLASSRPTTILTTIAVCFSYPKISLDLYTYLHSLQAARLSMNIRAITMGRAMDVLAQQSRVVPSILFRVPESDGQETRNEPFDDGTESEESRDDDEDNHVEFLDLKELCTTASR